MDTLTPCSPAFLLPSPLLANAGTPLLWAAGFHLFVGNLILGIVEGLAVGLLFKRDRALCTALLIPANYISAWLGIVVLQAAVRQGLDLHPGNFQTWYWILAVCLYFFTLVLEWPFVAFCFWKAERWFLRSVLATLLVQTVSCFGLYAYYDSVSSRSLLSDLTLVPASEIAIPEDVAIYYIAQEDGDVYRIDANGSHERIMSLGSFRPSGRLTVEETMGKKSFNIIAHPFEYQEPDPDSVLVLSGLDEEHVPVQRSDEPVSGWQILNSIGPVPRLGAARNSDWKFNTGYWAIEGLRGEHKSGETFRVSLETLFGEWRICNATHLPGDLVVFQLDRQQVCLLDVDNRRLALLARGHGPIAVLEPRTDEKKAASPPPAGVPE